MRYICHRCFLSVIFVVLAFVFSTSADVTVVFNEIMYHPDVENEADLEWVELHNQLAVDMDVSGWSLAGGVEYLFPEGTVVPGGGYLVVASSPASLMAAAGITDVLGPFDGRLSNGGETLELRNNNNRLMDRLEYGTDGEWPVAPDGTGPSLAKVDEDGAAAESANWSASLVFGGTPGMPNLPAGDPLVNARVVALDGLWRFCDGFYPGAAWNTPGFDDSAWSQAPAVFYSGTAGGWGGGVPEAITTLFSSGVDAEGQALAPGQADPHYTITASAYSTPPPPAISATVMANHPNWLANTEDSRWIGVVPGGTTGVPVGNYNFRTTFDLGGMDPESASVDLRFAADNRVNAVLLNGVDQGLSYIGFNAFSPLHTLADDFVEGTNTLDFYTANDPSNLNPAGFRVEIAGTAAYWMPTNTALPVSQETRYFRTYFSVTGDLSTAVLTLRTVLDDGAVYYINGVEVLRLNIPDGAVSHTTRSITNVAEAALSPPRTLPTASLVHGMNVLAVEVHQAAAGSNDMIFGAELSLSVTNRLVPWVPPLAFNEIAAATNQEELVEIINYGLQSCSLSNCVLRRMGVSGGEYLLPNIPLAAGERVVFNVAEFGFSVNPGDRLVLYTAERDAVIDAASARHYPRARWPEGTGAWRHPALPTFGSVNSVDFQSDIVINELMYHPRDPQGPDYASPEQWIELYNRGAGAVNLNGWRLEIDGRTAFRFSAGHSIAPDGYLVLARDAAYLQSLHPAVAIAGDLEENLPRGGGRIDLFDAAGLPMHPDADPDESGNPADVVDYGDGSPWPEYADGLGASLELADPRSDNARPEAWAASDDSSRSSWQYYSYTGIAAQEAASSPTLWKEFVLGLIGDGEVLLDDLSVIEDHPVNGPIEMLQDGSFEGGGSAWRSLGNHRRTQVVDDPDNAGNKVLHLVSSGYTEHMHNHVETTLADGDYIVNGRQYNISFRARWLAGCNRLLTRLYFNRLPKLTEIAMPSGNGTPGARNSRYAVNRGPTFSGLSHTPVVPSAGQAVAVSAVASDPDGVASAVLRYSVDGGSFTALAMSLGALSEGGVSLHGQIPAQADGRIVQFYIEAFDSAGAAAFMPAAGEDSRALYEVAPANALAEGLRGIRIVMTPADAAFLHTSINVMSNDRMGCTLVTDEKRAFYDCGVHLQGSERGRNVSSRVGFNVRLPFDSPYRGVLDTITVDRSGGYSGKGGDHDEILLKHAINKAGGLPGMYDDLCRVFAPRPQEDGTGLLILAKYNDEFLDSQYEDGGRGELFKLELVYYPTTTQTGDPESYKLPQPDSVLGTDIKDLGDDPEAYRWTFLKENRTDRNHYAPMVELAKAFSLSGDELDARMNELMDVDEWMRGVAFLALIGGADIYTYGNSHNAIFYFPPDGKARLFLWDMDYSFVMSTSAGFPGTGSPNTLKLINRPDNLHAYYGHLYDLTSVTGDSAYMGEWADRYAGLLGEDWSAAVTYLKARADYVRSQLPAPVPFAITTNGGADFTAGGSPVTLTGNGSITVKTVTINGVEYPVSWSGATAWSVTVPLPELTNWLDIAAYDLHGDPLPGGTDSITIINSGTLAPQPVCVNEWMADNAGPGGLPDPADGKFQDWFELYNPNAFPVDLTGYTLTDNLTQPAKWTIPSNTVITAHGYLLVWADDESFQSGLHAAFKLGAGGEELALFSPEGILQHSVAFGEQSENISQGFFPDGSGGAVCEMPRWTPSAPNRIGAPVVPDILVFDTSSAGTAIIQAQTDPGRAYVIEYKNDLQEGGWMPLYTNRAATALSSFIDVSPGVDKRFYRARLLP